MCIHKSITLDKVAAATLDQMTTLDNPGFCIACGFKSNECEPDACEYECESCGEPKVYGAAELLGLMEGM